MVAKMAVLDLFFEILDAWEGGVDLPEHALKAFFCAAIIDSLVNIEFARAAIQCVNVIVRHYKYGGTSSESLSGWAHKLTSKYPGDLPILERAASIMSTLVTHYAVAFSCDDLLVLHPPVTHLLNVLSLLVTVDFAITFALPENGSQENTQVVESVRLYVIYAMNCHPARVDIAEKACQILLVMRKFDITVDEALIRALQTSGRLCFRNLMTAMACAYFFVKADPAWIDGVHVKVLVDSAHVHGKDLTFLGNCMSALNMCAKAPAGPPDLSDFFLTAMNTHPTVAAIQASGCLYFTSLAYVSTTTVEEQLSFAHAVYLAMERFSDNANIQCYGCQVLYGLVANNKEIAAQLKKAYIDVVQFALMKHRGCKPLLLAGFQCLSSYYSLLHLSKFSETAHSIVGQCTSLFCDEPGMKDDAAAYKMVSVTAMRLLGFCLVKVTTANAHYYCDSVRKLIRGARPFFEEDEMQCKCVARILCAWTNRYTIDNTQYYGDLLKLISCYTSTVSVFFPSTAAIRNILPFITLTVGQCDILTTVLGRALSLKCANQDADAAVVCVDCLHVMYLKCPKVGKRLVHSQAFKFIVSICRQPLRDTELRIKCKAMVSTVSKTLPCLKSLVLSLK